MVMSAAFFDNYSFFFSAKRRPCHVITKMVTGFYWQTKCVWSPLMQRHPPNSWALQQCGLGVSYSEAFYSLWISVKSLSRHTALYSPPLFGTLGGHFTSNSVAEREHRISSTYSAESVWFGCRPAKFVLEMKFLSSPSKQGSHRMLHFTLCIFCPGI